MCHICVLYTCAVCLIFSIRCVLLADTLLFIILKGQLPGICWKLLSSLNINLQLPYESDAVVFVLLSPLWHGSHWHSLYYSWTDSFPAAAARFNSEAVKQFQLAITTFDENKLGARNITDGKHNSRQWNHIRANGGCHSK